MQEKKPLQDRFVPATGKPDGKKSQLSRTNSSALLGTKTGSTPCGSSTSQCGRKPHFFTQGGAVKFKPAKPRPANRKSKKIYTDDVIAALRLIRAFFRYKCGKPPAPLMRQQMGYTVLLSSP
jgi:hypothetical protein